MANSSNHGINWDYLNTKGIGLSCVIYVLYCLFYISGSNSQLHNYIQIGLFIVWILVAFLEDNISFSKAVFNKTTAFLFLYLLYYFITSYKADVYYTLTYEAVFLMIYSCYIPFLYYWNRARLYEIKTIVIICLLGWSFFSIAALVFYSIFPSAARTLAADFNAFDNLYIGGGYAIAFGSALLFVLLFSIVCGGYLKKDKKCLIITSLFLVLIFYLIIKTESTTTLIACVAGALWSAISIWHHSKKLIMKFLFIIFVSIISIFIISGGINYLGTELTEATDNGASDNVLLRRFNRIGEKLMFAGDGGGADNYVDERWGLVVESWDTFTENLIFGIGYTVGNVFSQLESHGVGTHSEICDILAQHGLVGFLLFFLFFRSAYRLKPFRLANNSVLITIIIMAIFNPFRFYHCFFVLFTLVPMIEILLVYKRNKVRKLK